jgi:hypothetical protein
LLHQSGGFSGGLNSTRGFKGVIQDQNRPGGVSVFRTSSSRIRSSSGPARFQISTHFFVNARSFLVTLELYHARLCLARSKARLTTTINHR